jgi:AraC-like DNA-binding protein
VPAFDKRLFQPLTRIRLTASGRIVRQVTWHEFEMPGVSKGDTVRPPMLDVQSTGPCLALKPYVRCYTQRTGCDKGVISVDRVVARLEQAIEFQFETPYEIHQEGIEIARVAPLAAVIGPQTRRRFTVFIKGPVEAFAIIFQPAGFYRLFKIPLSEFADDGTDGSLVFGSIVMSLRERLGEVNHFAGRVRIAEEFLLPRLARVDERDPFAYIAASLLNVEVGSRIGEIASQIGLSLRQFERRFQQCAGVTPKLFGKIARFQAALEQKKRFPSRSWMTVAHACGYFDQMHLVRDFWDLGGASPSCVSTDVPAEHINHLLEFPQDMK